MILGLNGAYERVIRRKQTPNLNKKLVDLINYWRAPKGKTIKEVCSSLVEFPFMCFFFFLPAKGNVFWMLICEFAT